MPNTPDRGKQQPNTDQQRKRQQLNDKALQEADGDNDADENENGEIEYAIFVLSQRGDEEATSALLDIARQASVPSQAIRSSCWQTSQRAISIRATARPLWNCSKNFIAKAQPFAW